jgi:chemotaxis protein methyltransferase CheR
LLGSWPIKGRFQAIFCRNAAIYFDDPTREQLWGRFAPKLSPGGTLYVGHFERVTGEAAQMFEGEGATIYRLRQGTRP